MDALSSSSLFAPFCHKPKSIMAYSNASTPFHVSSVQIQDKPNNTPRKTATISTTTMTTGTTTTTTEKPPLPKSASEPKRESVATTTTTTTPTSRPSDITSRKRRTIEASLQNTIFNTFDDIINTFIDPPIRPSVDPKHVLSNNFAPVDELPPTECPIIEGTLPSCLNGAYIRNGPNPQYLPRGPYHLFDGDGMLHSLLISQGRATFCSRYVKTYKFQTELQAGSPVFPNVFSGFNGLPAMATRGALAAARVLSGHYDPSNGIGLANTSLAFFGDRLLALGESDLPYTVRVTKEGDIDTIGRHNFDGKLRMSMTAHPKVDADTGEVFAFQYSPIPPFLTFFRFDASGSKQEPDVPIFSMTTPTFVHDFAITKKYAIFADIQIGMNMNPMEMIMGGGPVGPNKEKVPRIGVIPRYAKDESDMRWFDVPGFNLIHAINAWDEDEGDAIVVMAPNILSFEHTLDRLELVHASVEKLRIDLKTGIVSRLPISARNLDFGVINPAFLGKKNRYGYAGVGNPMPKISGVVKLDWSSSDESELDHKDRTVGSRMFGRGCYGGEPFFVAKEDAKEEDDGYVVTYMHDETTGESQFLVMDAKSPTLDVVAAVKLPRRVPYGFHGLFVSESDLKKQQLS